jgi:hypothetical protein
MSQSRAAVSGVRQAPNRRDLPPSIALLVTIAEVQASASKGFENAFGPALADHVDDLGLDKILTDELLISVDTYWNLVQEYGMGHNNVKKSLPTVSNLSTVLENVYVAVIRVLLRVKPDELRAAFNNNSLVRDHPLRSCFSSKKAWSLFEATETTLDVLMFLPSSHPFVKDLKSGRRTILYSKAIKELHSCFTTMVGPSTRIDWSSSPRT